MNANPSYEVKFLLKDGKVLNSDHKLKDKYKTLFNINEELDMAMLYLDTKNTKLLNAQGWNVRVRKKETSSKTEFTFKKRYAVENNNLEAVLTAAAEEGFNAENTAYECEVDWGFAKKTLSFSYEKKNKFADLKDTELPTKTVCVSYAKQFSPAEFNNYVYAGWGNENLDNCKKFGPVSAIRYKGTFNDLELSVEVWKVIEEDGSGYDYIVEASFKADDYIAALENKCDLMTLLVSKDILKAKDSLKTQLILERYN